MELSEGRRWEGWGCNGFSTSRAGVARLVSEEHINKRRRSTCSTYYGFSNSRAGVSRVV